MKNQLTIALGADHGGFEIKEAIVNYLQEQGYDVVDFGAENTQSVDYSDYANLVSLEVSSERADLGILCCSSGVGMSIGANRYRGISAAVANDVDEAKTVREHNNANVLCLAGKKLSTQVAIEIAQAFIDAEFAGGRHEARILKASGSRLAQVDADIFDLVEKEGKRQRSHIELIASENFTSPAVMEAQGSLLTNKYAEGYPGRRWYGGCEVVDEVEQIAIDRAKELFGAEHANVQPHSGSQANMAVYFAVLEPGDKILTMDLAHGGHLTHGHPANFSGKLYEVEHYGVSEKDEYIDYDALEAQAQKFQPKLITCGASAYPQIIDFERVGKIAKSVGAYLFVDMAHIAGLVAAGVHPTPVPHADFVTTTTHKSLRGPRGGIILCKEEYAKKISARVFPGVQGGPLMHVIAAKAVCFAEALKPEFKEYQEQVVKNTKAMVETFQDLGVRVVSNGSENHLLLLDLRSVGTDGSVAQIALDKAGITLNKNAIPFDTGSPMSPSGVRIGTPAVTTRGMKEDDVKQVATWIVEVLKNHEDEALLADIHEQVVEFNQNFPLPY